MSDLIEQWRGRIVLLEKTALAALEQVSSMEELQAWKRVYIEGRPPAPAGALFSTFVTSGEILDWEMHEVTSIRAELADEAYCRWLEQDRERAREYSDAWVGHVVVTPDGYHVWIETET